LLGAHSTIESSGDGRYPVAPRDRNGQRGDKPDARPRKATSLGSGFVVDAGGIIKSRHLEEDYRKRYTAGNILTDARYSDWKNWDNVPFPKHIEINRPRDEYAVVIDIVKMDINKGLGPDKFVLDQPEGTTTQIVGQTPANPPTPGPPPAKGRTKKK